MTRRTRSPFLHRSFGMLVLLLMGAGSGVFAAGGHGSQRHPVSRAVFVTDSRCAADDEKHGENGRERAAVLKCLARGADLVLEELSTHRIFAVEYESQDLVIRMTNEFAGREAIVKGLWDDQNLTVLVQQVLPAQPNEEIGMAPRRN